MNLHDYKSVLKEVEKDGLVLLRTNYLNDFSKAVPGRELSMNIFKSEQYNLCWVALRTAPSVFKNFPAYLKADFRMVVEAMVQDHTTLRYAAPFLQVHPQIVELFHQIVDEPNSSSEVPVFEGEVSE